MPKKITLLAPLTPYRGGIARHSTALARAIAARGDCEIVAESFALLYPRLLYPGQAVRDPHLAAPDFCEVVEAVDAIDPLTWRAAVHRIAARRPEVVAIPAWTFFVAPALGAIARGLRRRGIEVVQIVHNAADHDGARWKNLLTDWQLAAADRHVTHGEAIAAQLPAGVPVQVCPHPVYSDYPAATASLPREAGLELLCFGLMRPYKGIDVALAGLAASGRSDVRLTVAGEPWQDLAALHRLAADLGIAGQVEFIARYVADAEAAELFARADAVVASYREVTGSGVVALAHHYHRPVIASDLPGLALHVDHGRTGWLFPAGDGDALGALLRGPVSRQGAAAMAPAIAALAADNGWDRLAALVTGLPPPQFAGGL